MVQNKSVITRQNRCWFFFLHFWHSACLCVLSREPRPIKNLILPALHAQHGPHWMEAHPPLLWRIQLYPAASTFPSGRQRFPSLQSGTETLNFSWLQACALLTSFSARMFCGTILFLESWLLNPNFFLFSFNATNELLLCFKYLF